MTLQQKSGVIPKVVNIYSDSLVWYEKGCSMIGGCCCTTKDDIKILSGILSENLDK